MVDPRTKRLAAVLPLADALVTKTADRSGERLGGEPGCIACGACNLGKPRNVAIGAVVALVEPEMTWTRVLYGCGGVVCR